MVGFFTTFALASIVTSAQALPFFAWSLPYNCDRSTTVLAGDGCNALCAGQSVSTYQLRHVNTWINRQCTNLSGGDAICLGITGQDCANTYVVQYADTCIQIAENFDIPVSTLLSNNRNVNNQCTNLHIGEVLCVSSTEYPYNSAQWTRSIL